MADSKKKYSFYALVLIIALFAAGIIYFQQKPEKQKASPAETVLPSAPKDTIPMPDSAQWLSDSTHVFLMKNTQLLPAKNYPVRREVKLDGEAFLDVPSASAPLTIYTKLLTLTVKGKAAFLVMAPGKEEWAEIQVISGTIIARKAYSSDFNEPDTLQGNQMVMINRTIDLMEKEKFDATDLKAWRARLP